MAYAINEHFVKLSHGIVNKKDAMKYEALRISTFDKLPPLVPQSALVLAKAGFFYTGTDDECECYECGLKLKDWGPHDKPLEVHKQLSSDCPIVINNNSADNIPLASQYSKQFCVAAAAPVHANQKESGKKPLNDVPENKQPSVSDLKVQEEIKVTKQYQSKPTEQSDDISTQDNQRRFLNGNLSAEHKLLQSPSKQYASAVVRPNPQQNPVRYQSSPNDSPSNQNGSSAITNNPASHWQIESKDDYRYESNRLSSFRNWPSNAAVRPEDLAKSGFFYTGSDDRVQCTFCRGILRNWEPNDVPQSEHSRHFGQCPFLQNPFHVGNISLGDEVRGDINKNDPMTTDYCHGIVTEKAVNQGLSLPADRLATFKHFPDIIQKPEDFTRAGFFYSGIADDVKCFFCDGGLRNWEPNDDPWTEHARWFPRCGYLRLCKGDEYIKHVQSMYAPLSQFKKPPMRRRVNTVNKPVDEKQVSRYMNGKLVSSVLDMGFEKDKVRKVIIRRMQELGDEFFPNAESLFDAIVEYEEEEKYNEVYGEQDGESKAENTADKNSPNAQAKKNKKKKSKKKKVDQHNVVGNTEPLEYIDEDEAKSLAEDVQKLKDERTCKVCMDEEVNIVFLRCGHLVCCANCAPAMRHCPICRETIRGTVRVFLS